MNKTEIIFLALAIVILLSLIVMMPKYLFVYLFLLALAIIYLLMMFLAKYRKKYENRKLSIIFCIMGILLFLVYFVNSVYIDFTNKGSTADGLLILVLFIITISLGWFFEENKN